MLAIGLPAGAVMVRSCGRAILEVARDCDQRDLDLAWLNELA
jgi:hypothetical protein